LVIYRHCAAGIAIAVVRDLEGIAIVVACAGEQGKQDDKKDCEELRAFHSELLLFWILDKLFFFVFPA
jgi:hypothetical protein